MAPLTALVAVTLIILLVLTQRASLSMKLAPPRRYEVNLMLIAFTLEGNKDKSKERKFGSWLSVIPRLLGFRKRFSPIRKGLVYLIRRSKIKRAKNPDFDITLETYTFHLIVCLLIILYYKVKVKLKKRIRNVR